MTTVRMLAALSVFVAAMIAPLASVPQARQSQAEECTLGGVAPIVNDSPEARVKRNRHGPRDLVERTRLSSTLSVEVAQGGCADYGVRMTFTVPKYLESPARKPEPILAEAAAFLAILKQRTESSAVSITADILARHKNERYQDGDVLQDRAYPDATIYVSAHGDGHDRVVEVTYSMVL